MTMDKTRVVTDAFDLHYEGSVVSVFKGVVLSQASI